MTSFLADGLQEIGLSHTVVARFVRRANLSKDRLKAFQSAIRGPLEQITYPGLAIFCAGSFARLEASAHSDLDLFFIEDDQTHENQQMVANPTLSTFEIMAHVVNTLRGSRFPPPSNDGQYMRILKLSAILRNLGGAKDDYENHFTTRLLLLLESAPVFGEKNYASTLDQIVDAYMRDYEDHSDEFRPTFLVNDIIRYWKTVCLNYEHRRNQREEQTKIRQKIKNFKLGYSRLMTCFSSVAYLSSFNTIDKHEIVRMCEWTPVERLLALYQRNPDIVESLREAMGLYHWFLDLTEKSGEDLHGFFSDRQNRSHAFGNSRMFGRSMFDVVQRAAQKSGTLRYLVV